MKTIKITLGDNLIASVDQVVKKLKMTRSAFVRKALRDSIIAELEKQHRNGYERHPVDKEEFNAWTRNRREEALLRTRKIRASFGTKTFSDSADLIRADRDR